MNTGQTKTIRRRRTGTAVEPRPEDLFQVILHNDDYNAMEHVVRCLMRVFGHSEPLAIKIMLEAHERGKAVAEVEAETPARRHRDQLQSLGLTATVEPL